MPSTLTRLGAHPCAATRSSSGPAACVSCTLAGVASTPSTKPSEQVRIWRLIPFMFLLPSTPRSPFCGPDTTLCESKDGSGRLSGMALLLAHRAREHAATIGPDPVVVKPIMPGSDGFPRAKILGQVTPSAAGLVQIQAGVDHLAQIRCQRRVNRKIRRDCLPLRLRQVAWIAPAVVLVAFAMFRRPHGMLLLLHQERAIGGSGRGYISTAVKQALRHAWRPNQEFPERKARRRCLKSETSSLTFALSKQNVHG